MVECGYAGVRGSSHPRLRPASLPLLWAGWSGWSGCLVGCCLSFWAGLVGWRFGCCVGALGWLLVLPAAGSPFGDRAGRSAAKERRASRLQKVSGGCARVIEGSWVQGEGEGTSGLSRGIVRRRRLPLPSCCGQGCHLALQLVNRWGLWGLRLRGLLEVSQGLFGG